MFQHEAGSARFQRAPGIGRFLVHGEKDYSHPFVLLLQLHERLNARYLAVDDIGEPVDLAVCDVSFISVTLILPAIPPLLRPDAEMVILIKPQFEVGKGQVGKGGIVRDPALHAAACERIEDAVRRMNYRTDIIESPILGAEGNKEFLLYARH
jgi:23S rRNA (cytidine1920-2'-O)/16S rRNA (cytidine1409-2'-O)-methyltransferase